MKGVIIAGGLGTRLRPLTYTTPKPVIPIAGIPLVLRQIGYMKKFGISEFILCVNYLSYEVKKSLENGRSKGDTIHFCLEDKTLGTCGAVKNAEKHFNSEPLIVMNGDILTDVDLKAAIKFHKEKKAKATIILVSVEDPTSFGLVLTGKDGRVERFIEKPSPDMVSANTINAGIYILEPEIFSKVPEGEEHSFERELFPSLLEKGEGVFGFEAKAFWIDVGNPSKYMHASRAILQNELKLGIPGKKDDGGVWVDGNIKKGKEVKLYGPSFIGDGSVFEDDSKIYSMSVLGKNVRLGKNSSVSSSIIMDNSEIGNDVEIKDCIIGNNSIIEDDVYMHGGIVLADSSHIRKGSKLGVEL